MKIVGNVIAYFVNIENRRAQNIDQNHLQTTIFIYSHLENE